MNPDAPIVVTQIGSPPVRGVTCTDVGGAVIPWTTVTVAAPAAMDADPRFSVS